MYSNILVAYDGSDHADKAMDAALEMAAKFTADLHLVQVLDHTHATTGTAEYARSEHIDDPDGTVRGTWACQKIRSPVVSSGNLTPFGKGERAIEFENLAAAKMAFLVKMVVDRSVDQNELLERFRTPEFRHRTLSPPKRLV